MNILFSILMAVVLTAQIDSTEIMIGDQANLHIEAIGSAEDHVAWPQYDRPIGGVLEVVERSKVDTTIEKDGRVRLSQDLIITSFQDTLLYIEPLPIIVNGDTLHTNALSLNVIQPFELDSMNATEAITDIKDIYRAPIWWWGILRWVLLALVIIGLAVGGYYLYLWYKKKHVGEEVTIEPELLRPCDEVALEKLEQIRIEKLWQQGQTKEYHTQLTDVLREYISRRYDVSSQEKTSDETLAGMEPILKANDQRDLYEGLKKTLRLADLVKFAKWQTTPEENETALRNAFTFVEQTKMVESEEVKA